jgi:hypothetical protein
LRSRTDCRPGLRLASAALLTAAIVLAAPRSTTASEPTVADLDATARAAGNRLDVAVQVGRSIFSTTWPAQISQISANAVGPHMVIGIRLWGVKFHHPLTRAEFVGEVADLVEKAFAAAPAAEEVDLWASVPIRVPKGAVVSGDLALPTTRTVFSLSVRRGDSRQAIVSRAAGANAYWDDDWARSAFSVSARRA